MRLMVTGGGTGGHASPALAVVQELQRRDGRLLVQWVGRRGKIEERLCQRHRIPFRSVVMRGWPRKGVFRRGIAAMRLAISLAQALIYLVRFRPQVVFGVGGYVAVPLMLVAQRMGIPTVLHEQNKRLGMANRLLAERATHILTSYPETNGAEGRGQVMGNPVRSEFLRPPAWEEARAHFALDTGAPVVLVVGGSQGAQSINRAMAEALPALAESGVQVLWMTGSADAAWARERASRAGGAVQVHAFIDDMAAACTAADVVVSRAGASTTAELAALGKPAILVPYPYAAEHHQDENARAFEERGAAVVIDDASCTGAALTEAIEALAGDGDRLAAMSAAALELAAPAAADAIAETILAVVFEETATA